MLWPFAKHTLWRAETGKNRCCTPHIANFNRNKQVFWWFALLVIFTNLILLQSIIKAVNCYTWTTNIRVADRPKAYCFSALSNFNVKSCLLYLQEQPQPLKGITCRNISKQSKGNVFYSIWSAKAEPLSQPVWPEFGNGLPLTKQRRCQRDVSKSYNRDRFTLVRGPSR